MVDLNDVVPLGLVADRRQLAGLGRTVRVAGVASTGLGVCMLVGWAMGAGALMSVVPDVSPMRPNIAVCLVLTGLCLLVSFPASRVSVRGRAAVAVCAPVVGLVGLLTLAEYAVGVDLLLDRALFAREVGVKIMDVSHPGRMAPNTAIALVLVSGSQVLLLACRGSRSVLADQAMCVCSAGSVCSGSTATCTRCLSLSSSPA